MRILWIVNIELSALARHLGNNTGCGGGWMDGALKNLRMFFPELHIGVVSTFFGKTLEHYPIDGVDFYRVPYGSRKQYDKKSDHFFQELYRSFKPDLIHIHGTEYPHTLSAAENTEKIPAVVSLQGIISAYQPYALGQLSPLTLLMHTTPRDLVRFQLPTMLSRDMKKRGIFEQKTLMRVSHVIGRTDWDHAYALHLNPQLIYHFCNETLRDEFYVDSCWSYEKCSKHTIFTSNGSVPLKGVHHLISALALLRKKYPDVHLNIAGGNTLISHDWRNVLKRTAYNHYLNRLICRLDLQNNISFTGTISAEQMRQQFLRSNVYVLPSAIENSPNSLGEAQILGVPVVSAEAGGILSMVKHQENGLIYRYEDTVQLAYWIEKLFEDPELAIRMGKNARVEAFIRHDRKKNAETLMKIYQDVFQQNILS